MLIRSYLFSPTGASLALIEPPDFISGARPLPQPNWLFSLAFFLLEAFPFFNQMQGLKKKDLSATRPKKPTLHKLTRFSTRGIKSLLS